MDYSFVPIEPKNINYIYENDNYYFYEVILDIYIYPREPLVVSSELENILNEALGNSYGTPITRGELSKIKVLDLKGIDSSNINPVIFQYMPNLVELNLSSCNINEDFLSYLSTLTKLEFLITISPQLSNAPPPIPAPPLNRVPPIAVTEGQSSIVIVPTLVPTPPPIPAPPSPASATISASIA